MTRREDGFTVLEALVAFAILSVCLTALYAAAGTSLRSVDGGTQTRRAALLAQSKLDELAAERTPLPAAMQGAFNGTNVTWRVNVQDIPSGFAGFQVMKLQSVHLVLSWPRDGHTQTLILDTRHLGIIKQ